MGYWRWQGGGQEGYMVWVPDAPVVSPSQPATQVPAPAPAPATPSTGAAPGAAAAPSGPLRLRGGGQDAIEADADFTPGPESYATARGNPQGDSLQYRTPEFERNEDFMEARSSLLYGDPARALALLEDELFGVTSDEFSNWFSEDALRTEVDRIANYDRYSGSNKFTRGMAHFGDYVPALTSIALSAIAGQAFAGGAGAGAAAGGGSAAAAGGGTAASVAAGAESTALSAGATTAIAKAATQIALSTFMNGGDWRAAVANYLAGQGLNEAVGLVAPAVSETINSGFAGFSEPDLFGGAPDATQWQMAGLGGAEDGMFDLSGMRQPLSGPSSVVGSDGLARSAQPGMLGGFNAPAAGQSFVGDPLNTFGSGAPLMPPAMPESNPYNEPMMPPAVPEADPYGETLPPTPPPTTPADVQRYARLANTVREILGGEDAPSGAPNQDEGETPEQYSAELADYLGLDAATMAEAGLQPGSPEYYEFIMSRADQVIADVLGDISPDAEDLADQLRGKTEQEMMELQRALYVRGQVGMLMGSGTYEDPATGNPEDVVGGGMFNPGVGAYQRGLARSVSDLSNMSGPDAMEYMQQLLGRNVDWFGMDQSAAARFEQAKLEESDPRRRRGMFSF
jgi:hypothetical protein